MPYTSEKRLYLTADGKVVEEGDPNAATLLVGEGGQLSDEDAEHYGLVKGKAVNNANEAPAEDATEGEKADTAPRTNKARTAPENKAG